MKKLSIALGLGVLLTGCVADNGWKVAHEQEKAARQEQDSRIRNLEAQQRQQTAPRQQAPQEQELTRAQSIAYCQQLDNDNETPFYCSMVTLDDGMQVMTFSFQDEQTMSKYWKSITENLAVHYCVTSVKSNIKAALGQILYKEDAVRMFSCHTNKWNEWAKADLQRRQNTSTQRY
jgi:hypothetical protein